MIQSMYRLMIELTNHRLTSSAIRRFSESSLSKRIVPKFAKAYSLNMEEANAPLSSYATLKDLFIRELKEGARPIEGDETTLVSPVDAVIADIGPISAEQTIVVKGKSYSIEEMLGGQATAQKYEGGQFLVLYLSPSHYHRIHSPVNGTIERQWTLGNRSYPVNRLGLKYGVRTLAKNYRLISEIVAGDTTVAVVKVGATFVNSIVPLQTSGTIAKGDQLGYFAFGSTVVLLLEKDAYTLRADLTLPSDIYVGQTIATRN